MVQHQSIFSMISGTNTAGHPIPAIISCTQFQLSPTLFPSPRAFSQQCIGQTKTRSYHQFPLSNFNHTHLTGKLLSLEEWVYTGKENGRNTQCKVGNHQVQNEFDFNKVNHPAVWVQAAKSIITKEFEISVNDNTNSPRYLLYSLSTAELPCPFWRHPPIPRSNSCWDVNYFNPPEKLSLQICPNIKRTSSLNHFCLVTHTSEFFRSTFNQNTCSTQPSISPLASPKNRVFLPTNPPTSCGIPRSSRTPSSRLDRHGTTGLQRRPWTLSLMARCWRLEGRCPW